LARVAEIGYGLDESGDLFEVDRDGNVCGGCCVGDEGPRWRCQTCKAEWGRVLATDLPRPMEIDLRACLLDLEHWGTGPTPEMRRSPGRSIPEDLRGAGCGGGPWYWIRAAEEEYNLAVTSLVIWVGPNRVQAIEPVSLTPLGPCGPMLNFGDVFEVTLLEDGSYGYVRLLERIRVWSRTLADPAELARGENEAVQSLVDELATFSCVTEWCSGNLTVQTQLEERQMEPARMVLELVETLAEMLEESKAEYY
jgi:hypothetical protein